MSFFDKVKDASDKAGKSIQKSYQEQQQKSAELKDIRGAKLDALAVEYMGGYGDGRKANGIITFYQNQTEFSAVMSTKFTIPNSQIKDILVEGKDEVKITTFFPPTDANALVTRASSSFQDVALKFSPAFVKGDFILSESYNDNTDA